MIGWKEASGVTDELAPVCKYLKALPLGCDQCLTSCCWKAQESVALIWQPVWKSDEVTDQRHSMALVLFVWLTGWCLSPKVLKNLFNIYCWVHCWNLMQLLFIWYQNCSFILWFLSLWIYMHAQKASHSTEVT